MKPPPPTPPLMFRAYWESKNQEFAIGSRKALLPSWHIAMARGDKNLLTYDDLCSVYLFQQLLSKGLHRTPIAFIISEIAKTGLTHNLKSGFRYMIWNTKYPREGGKVALLTKIPNSIIDISIQMLVVDLLKVKNEVDRKRQKRGSKRLPSATLIQRQSLAFDTTYAAAAAGKPERVGHLFVLLAGRFVSDRGEQLDAPMALMLSDDEVERRDKTSRTFRTDGEHVHVVQLRLPYEHVKVPIGMTAGPLAFTSGCWQTASALLEVGHRGDAGLLAQVFEALAGAGIVSATLTQTVMAEEPERFRRLWAALQPLYATYGATTSLKQLASSLGMSMRQVGRDAKEMSAAFGIGGGYRDALLVLRLRVAVLLLAAPGAGVSDVAKLAGYGSPIAMARAFRDAKLPSPSVIQAALRGE